MFRLSALGALALILCATPALADPCKAIPDRGQLPTYLYPGAEFSGRVVYVGDGDSLCVANGPSTQDWIEVRLADFYAPELQAPGGEAAKRALLRLTMGRRLTCKANHRSYDRIAATCRREGKSVGDLMRAAGIKEGGRGRGRRY
jgi:endonuclease YncB( thermonuclease family)